MEQLIKLRTAAKVRSTRASNKLRELLEQKPGSINEIELRDAIDQFDMRLTAIDQAQAAIEEETSIEELDSEVEKAEEYRDKIRIHRISAINYLDSLVIKPQDNQDKSDSVSQMSNHSSNSAATCNPNVRLPQLTLPEFSGNVIEWQGFWDKFVAIVDNSSIPEINKFTYLQSLLTGEAKSAIQGLSITEKHYRIACDILKERYGRKERIIFTHIQELLKIDVPSSSRQSKTSMLWKLQDELLTHIRSLEALNVKGEQYGVILTPLILSRLPQDIRMEWAREGSEHESDLQFLLDFLNKEIQRRERSETFKEIKRTDPETHEQRSRRIPTTSALQTSTHSPSCVFCGKTHWSEKCYDILQKNIPERRQKIKTLGLCFKCLRKGHIAKFCQVKCDICKGKHNQLCCEEANSGKVSPQSHTKKSTQVSEKEKSSVSNVGVLHSHGSSDKMCTVLQTARVKLQGKKGFTHATILFDTGSDYSYVTSSVVNKIDPEWLTSRPMTYAAFGGKTSKGNLHNVFKLEMQGLHGGRGSLCAAEVKVICAPMVRPRIPARVLQSFEELEFADTYMENCELSVDILIGLDQYWNFVKQDIVRGIDGIVAQDTVFGWVISGSWQGVPKTMSHQLLCLTDIQDSELRRFWDLDSIGITSGKSVESDFIDPVLDRFNKSITYSEGEQRYEVSLPWKQSIDHDRLLDNEKLALNRLSSLSRRLARTPDLEVRYNKALEEMESLEIIREIQPEEKVVPYPVYYLPHHPVVKESSLTTKVRPVFDASAAGYNGVSLNDCMEAGPNMIPSLVEMLVRFRRWRIALTGDITKAFLQVKVCSKDQDVHRFLWNCGNKVRVMKFLRVPFGNKASPFLLNATIKYHLSKFSDSRVIEELKENLYVDDWLSGADTIEEGCKLYQEARAILLEANMALAKSTSNDLEVSDKLFKEDGVKFLDSDSVKILGLKWLRNSDCFSFEGVPVPPNLTTTKRVVLSFLARLYDPLGFLTPFIMVTKILLQEIWQLGLEWDAEVPIDLHNRFIHWVSGLETIYNWQIPRCYSHLGWNELIKSGLEIHAFGDASEKGYGTVVYLRLPQGNGTYQVSFVLAKARVAPLKKITLPRLELLGALLTARLLVFVRKTLKVQEVEYKCWTDSTVALGWIQGDPSRWKPFVANRVLEIQDLTNPSNWSHCSGKDNPADLVSRGMFAEDLTTSQLWLNGPPWLSKSSVSKHQLEQDIVFPKEEKLSVVNVSMVSHPQTSEVEVERWSSFKKALRIVAWIGRYVHNSQLPGSHRQKGDLSYDEISRAKVNLFMSVQNKCYETEIKVLQQGKLIPKTSSLVKLNPFIGKDGLLRIKGRLQESDLTYDEKHPILLPKCHLSKLLVRFQHNLLKHAGTDTVITSLRNSYWIVGLRRLVKSIKRECVSCQKVDATACNEPAAPLPELRVKEAPPFSVTGLDYAGPLYCCDLPRKKLYILLFTCAVVRAVHLELTDSLNQADFMLALRRFVARRGMPSVIYSDNAKTFVGAQEQLIRYFGHIAPQWKFIVPLSPWWGGWWERLVRSVKVGLRKSLGGKSLTKCELETTLQEVESCINSRPLTFVGDEVDSLSTLTPSHFLIGRSGGFQVSSVNEKETDHVSLSDREVVRLQRLNKFWSKWSDNYLRNLPPTVHQFRNKGKVKVGSVVLIREDNISRLKWPLGVVSQVFPGRDGIVRRVELKTAKGKLTRPIQRLHDLELVDKDVEEVRSVIDQTQLTKQPTTVTKYGRVCKTVDRLKL